MKAWIAAALMIVPLLIAAAINYWPAESISVSTVVIPPPDVHSPHDISVLANEIPAALSSALRENSKFQVQITEGAVDSKQAMGFDAVVITTLTEDAGIVQLNVQAARPRSRKEIWSNAYQSSREQYSEMLRAAGKGLRRALD